MGFLFFSSMVVVKMVVMLLLLASNRAEEPMVATTESYSEAPDVAHRLDALMLACGQLCNTSMPVQFSFCNPTPSNMCLQDISIPYSSWEPLQKETNCKSLWTSPHFIAKRPEHLPAPERVPPSMLSAFSYNGRVQVRYGGFFSKWPNVAGQNMPVWHKDLVDEWITDCSKGWIEGSYGFVEGIYEALYFYVQHL